MMKTADLEKEICSCICESEGIKARDIAGRLRIDRTAVNQILYRSSLLFYTGT